MSTLTNNELTDEAPRKVPWYVIAAWAVFAVAYVTHQLIYLVPDLRTWLGATG